jgi:hypothetical protein
MVPPAFTNINDMTKVANADCVAFFTLIANATDCAGVTITNNSPTVQPAVQTQVEIIRLE